MTREQRIAIWVVTLIGMLVAWKLFGQGFGGFRSDQPFLARTPSASQPFDPTNIPGLFLNWQFTDMESNVTIVGWTDRVQQVVFRPKYDSPTNTAKGLLMTNTYGQQATYQYLTNITPTHAGTQGVGVVVAWNFKQDRKWPAANRYALTALEASHMFYLKSSAGGHTLTWFDGFDTDFTATTLATNAFNSLVICASNNNNVTDTSYFFIYTNGVLSETASMNVKSTNLFRFDQLGFRQDDNYLYSGKWQSIQVWTNINDWSSYSTNYQTFVSNAFYNL